MITIITPVFCSSTENYLFARTLWFLENAYISPEIKRIVVDYASPEHITKEFRAICEKRNILFVELKKHGQLYSSGECRNVGVSLARTKYVSFQDVDLFAPEYIYKTILAEIKELHYYNDLFCIPCLYLSESHTKDYYDCQNDEEVATLFDKTYNYYLNMDANILIYAPVTSMIVLQRAYFMEIGGNYLEFQGHGFEDFESLHRLASSSNKFMKPIDYYNHDHKYNSPSYMGYRNYFSLFGRELMNRKIFFVHLWHPKHENKTYITRNHINKALFSKCMKQFDKSNWLPDPLNDISLENNKKTLILAPKHGKTTASIRVAIPHLGNLVYAQDKEFHNVEQFNSFLVKNNVNRVLFFNSFGNPHRKELYDFCLKHNIKTINFDRGALPDSWFFDPNGFNYASTSYQSYKNRKLSAEESLSVINYINDTLTLDNELEKNGVRIGDYAFRNKYHLVNKKVLFVPLQRPNDSVITYFSDKLESMEKYIQSIDEIAETLLDDDWIILIKQHPLEPSLEATLRSRNIIVMHSDDNFKDAISVSSAVLTINSGVGLYSLMFNRPTFNIGNAFYSSPGLSNKIDYVHELAEKLKNLELYLPDEKKVHLFIHYLVNEFYSFGETIYSIETNQGVSTRNARYIDFTILRIPNNKSSFKTISITRRLEPFKLSSPVYDYYRSWIQLRHKIEQLEKEKEELIKISKEQKNHPPLLEKDLSAKGHPKEQPNFAALAEKEDIVINKQDISDTKKPSTIRKLKKLHHTPGLFLKDAYRNLINRITFK